MSLLRSGGTDVVAVGLPVGIRPESLPADRDAYPPMQEGPCG